MMVAMPGVSNGVQAAVAATTFTDGVALSQG